MDRQIVKSGQIPLETDILNSERSTMTALGWALQGLLGTSTLVDGLACAPTSPASMSVTVAPGQILTLATIDGSSYSTLAADTAHSIVKQGLVLDAVTLTATAPGTSGQSQNYLVQAIYADADDTPIVRPYYNSANPSVGLSGPGGTGVADNTFRRGKCTVSLKAGAAATTGTQTTPAPDAGNVGLYSITVANGQTTVTSGNITQLATAPFIPTGTKLPNIPAAVQNGTWIYEVDTGAANALVVTPSPAIASLVAGLKLRVKVLATNTGTSTINPSGLGAVGIIRPSGGALVGGELVATAIVELIYDGVNFQLVSLQARRQLLANLTLFVNGSTGSDSNNGLGSGTAFLTIQKASDFIQKSLDLAGFVVTVQVVDGTLAAGVAVAGPYVGAAGPQSVVFQGNLSTPANCIIAIASGAHNFSATRGAKYTVQGFKLTNASAVGFAGILSINPGSHVLIGGAMDFGAMASINHINADTLGAVQITSSYAITASAPCHWQTANGGLIYISIAVTITLTGTPLFAAAFAVAAKSSITAVLATFSGSATGVRYSVIANGVIDTGGVANFLPGGSAGSTATGGQYV